MHTYIHAYIHKTHLVCPLIQGSKHTAQQLCKPRPAQVLHACGENSGCVGCMYMCVVCARTLVQKCACVFVVCAYM